MGVVKLTIPLLYTNVKLLLELHDTLKLLIIPEYIKSKPLKRLFNNYFLQLSF